MIFIDADQVVHGLLQKKSLSNVDFLLKVNIAKFEKFDNNETSLKLNLNLAVQIEEMKKLQQRIEEIADQMHEDRNMTVEMSKEVSQICKLKKSTAFCCNLKRI